MIEDEDIILFELSQYFSLVLFLLLLFKKTFIIALSFAYFSKTLCGAYMKSSITQIERRFDIASSVVGLIDGGFEMGLY